MKKALFIYNPLSGENKILNELDTVISIHQKYGFYVNPLRIDDNVDLEGFFKDYKGGYEHIVLAGGDGTVDSLVNILIKNNIDIPIGVLPMGTANDYANYIGMSSDVEEACRQILTLPAIDMDLGKVNDKYFINVLSTGFFTDISQRTDNDLKNSIGKLAYYLKSIQLLKDVRRTKIKIESEDYNYEGDMFIMMVFNGITSGGIKMAYKSVGNDGLLDVIILNGSMTELIPLAIKILKGDHLEKPKGLEYFQTKALKITCDEEIPSDIDGEKGPGFPMEISCVTGKLKVLGVRNKL